MGLCSRADDFEALIGQNLERVHTLKVLQNVAHFTQRANAIDRFDAFLAGTHQDAELVINQVIVILAFGTLSDARKDFTVLNRD